MPQNNNIAQTFPPNKFPDDLAEGQIYLLNTPNGMLHLATKGGFKTFYGLNHDTSKGWAGIPVTTGHWPGAFEFKEDRHHMTQACTLGLITFLEMAKQVRTLSTNYRENQYQDMYKRILDEAYEGAVSEDNADWLMELHLDHPQFSASNRQITRECSIHVFADIDPMLEHNEKHLYKTTSSKNIKGPVVEYNVSCNHQPWNSDSDDQPWDQDSDSASE